MKCPKCSYLGFERVDRCRNCGYDFSLTSPAPAPDFAIRRESETESMNTAVDLSLIDAANTSLPLQSIADINADLDRVFGEPEPEPSRAATASMSLAAISEAPRVAPRPAPREDLPLFGPPIPDDEPLITKASPPRAPLAVRRATPEVARLRAAPPRTPSLDLALDVADSSPIPIVLPAERATAGSWQTVSDTAQDAAVGARCVAVLIDLLILAAIDAAVVYFTMQLCYLTIEDLWMLPKGPLLAFLVVQNGGYLVTFTAGGQTLGKMAVGIRVVPSEADAPLDLGRAFLRTLMWGVLAVPAGLGFLTALFSRDHRGLHDRFAGTRVIRASASA